MLAAYEASLPYRLAFGLTFFAALSAWELRRRGWSSPRLREYGFLVVATLASIVYAIVHDQITSTISREYFWYAKNLASDPRPFRMAVAVLAVKASYWVGLVVGTAMLVANNPSPRRPQLPYATMFRLMLWPFALAVVGAIVLGYSSVSIDVGHHATAMAIAGGKAANDFLFVWGVHLGSYVGGFVGCVVAIAVVVAKRRRA